MKQYAWLVGAVCLSMVSVASADGIYVGAGAGVMQLKSAYDYSSSETGAPTYNNNFTGRGTSLNGTVLLGYAWDHPNDYFIGLETYSNVSDAQATGTLANGAQLHLKLQNAYGIRVLPGYYFTPDTVGYGIIGLARGNFKLSDDYGDSDSEYLNGYQVGVGSMTKLTPNVGLRGDVIYTSYNKMKESESASDGEFTASESLSAKPTTLEANVDLIYSFG